MMPMQSRPDGGAVVYQGFPFSGGLAAGPNEYLSGRTPGGWATQSLSSPLFANGSASGAGYQAFSPDLSRAVVYQIEPPLSPQAPTLGGESYANLYLREADGTLRPLLTEAPPNREPNVAGNTFRIRFGGANAGAPGAPAFSHVVFGADDALTGPSADAPAAVDGGVVNEGSRQLNLYEWHEGGLRLVNVAPGNATTAPGAVLGSGIILATPAPQSEGLAVDHAVSDDGRRVFWSEEGSGQLYVRIDGEETRKVEDPGLFLTATPDGDKALLSDGCLYDVEEETCEDLTLDQDEVHQGGFQGILGAAEDLTRIYFVDTKALTPPGEANANGEHAEAGKLNLYAWDEGATSFVGQLLKRDNEVAAIGGEWGDWKASRSGRTAQVSADGRYLAFMSKARLTGYDNSLAGGGECIVGGGPACFEVFAYDGDTGRLTCASCNPTGQRPLGRANLSVIKGTPGFPPSRQPANLSAEGRGRLFFESQDALSPRDLNGNLQDVYEWEPGGVGGCEEAGGCVYLISSGQSANDSIFLDSSASGNDVFLITREQLLGRDEDELLDLYDARVGGGIEEAEAPPCLGEACKGPFSSDPGQQGAGSASFAGPGNPPRHHGKKRHHKKRKHRRGRGGSR
jgi:hypothetical protein